MQEFMKANNSGVAELSICLDTGALHRPYSGRWGNLHANIRFFYGLFNAVRNLKIRIWNHTVDETNDSPLTRRPITTAYTVGAVFQDLIPPIALSSIANTLEHLDIQIDPPPGRTAGGESPVFDPDPANREEREGWLEHVDQFEGFDSISEWPYAVHTSTSLSAFSNLKRLTVDQSLLVDAMTSSPPYGQPPADVLLPTPEIEQITIHNPTLSIFNNLSTIPGAKTAQSAQLHTIEFIFQTPDRQRRDRFLHGKHEVWDSLASAGIVAWICCGTQRVRKYGTPQVIA